MSCGHERRIAQQPSSSPARSTHSQLAVARPGQPRRSPDQAIHYAQAMKAPGEKLLGTTDATTTLNAAYKGQDIADTRELLGTGPKPTHRRARATTAAAVVAAAAAVAVCVAVVAMASEDHAARQACDGACPEHAATGDACISGRCWPDTMNISGATRIDLHYGALGVYKRSKGIHTCNGAPIYHRHHQAFWCAGPYMRCSVSSCRYCEATAVHRSPKSHKLTTLTAPRFDGSVGSMLLYRHDGGPHKTDRFHWVIGSGGGKHYNEPNCASLLVHSSTGVNAQTVPWCAGAFTLVAFDTKSSVADIHAASWRECNQTETGWCIAHGNDDDFPTKDSEWTAGMITAV
jgi:hypothetical protein